MMALSTQFFSGLQRIVARLELVLLSVAIRGAHQRALLLDKDQKITFYRDGSGYYSDHTEHRFAAGIVLAAPPGALGPPAAPRKRITNPVTFPDQTVTCYKNGIIHPGSIYLSDMRNAHFYALTSSIAQISFLRLYQYRLNWISL